MTSHTTDRADQPGSVRNRPDLPYPPRIGPVALADLLGLPTPTLEQQQVITAPLAPLVVVAGAGSGKTETMSARVVWLVANGYVSPDRVLGLTFTNKAATELAERIRIRLAQLRAHQGSEADPGEPTVLTYHAYAARLVAEHALRIGVEPSVRLLTQAMTWQFAERVVRSYDGDLPHVDRAESTVVGWVLALAGQLSEHLVGPAELRAWTDRFTDRCEGLPRGREMPGKPYAGVRRVLDACVARREILPLVERFDQAKRAAGGMDFGDQMSLAARITVGCPEVGQGERSRYAVVLLDEYQDTSHAQLALLRAMFAGGHPVTAVGDPCQSIYGWRGASAGNLTRFTRDFRTGDGTSAAVLPLGTSFRNDRRILDVANQVSEPLRAQGLDVGVLVPGPRGGDGVVRCALLSTAEEEAAWLADQIERVWSQDAVLRARGRSGRSVAVLARRRSQFERIEQALRARDVPVELVGLGGLLATPEVRDVVSTLRVLIDPDAGDALVRLLTGPRWRIGPRDLAALGRRARELVRERREVDQGPSAPGASEEPAVPAEDGSLVEALDDLGPAEAYSAEGLRRLEALRQELASLRRRTHQPLTDLVADVEHTLRLDVEVAAGGQDAGRVHLDRFGDVAAQFAEEAEVATLGAFLAYLATAEATERGLQPGQVEVDDERVQVLTVHAAKGLEWDVVAVPGLTDTVFPDGDAVGGSGWATSVGTLPYPLRGDAADLPDFEPDAADDQKELEELRKDFVARCRERGSLEERRLAYVALTRARHTLLCSGYWWDEAVQPRGPSEFLLEVRKTCLAGAGEVERWEARPADDAPNPMLARKREFAWPADPLAARRVDVAAGADLVRAALAAPAQTPQTSIEPGQTSLFDPDAQAWSTEVDLLLAERARRAAGGPVEVALPGHLSVSSLVVLRRDPAELARQIRRPMPFRPAPLARRGTAFHAWLEARYAGQGLLDVDDLPGAADEDVVPEADLDLLRERFLASDWADRRPLRVEVPFEILVDGVLVRGRMDAVFADGADFLVVDWKTGGRPAGTALRAAEVQLAAYRLAWSGLAGVPLERVRAAFHYVRDNQTVAPVNLLDRDGLAALLATVRRPAGGSASGDRLTI
ncbi:MAG TPA: UvrD-helicase domain-containing protein [Mycobacteriales bacterium]